MHCLQEKLVALEYTVVFLLEQEEKRILGKYESPFLTQDQIWNACSPEEFQTLARLEDLRRELHLHMTEKPDGPKRRDIPSDVMTFLEDCLHPEQLGYAVTPEVRDRVRELLGMPKVETRS